LTCDAVISEVCFLFLKRRATHPVTALFRWINQGIIALPFRLQEENHLIGELMKNYANVPMSLADACLGIRI
jgi:hypothetical protein